MTKFYVAGCFADSIVVNRDKNTIEKQSGGPAHFMKKVLDDLEEDYEVAKGKKGVSELHIEGGEEVGRLVNACKVSSAPITSSIVLVSSIANEIQVDKLKGEFEQIHVNTEGFVHDSQNFGSKKNWSVDKVDKIRVVLTTQHEMQYLPENLLSHVRNNGIFIVCKSEGKVTLVDKGEETDFDCGGHPPAECLGVRDVFLTAFSSEYFKSSDAKKAMGFAIEYSKGFLSEMVHGKDKE